MFGYFRPPTACAPAIIRKYNVPESLQGVGGVGGVQAQQQKLDVDAAHYSRRSPSLFPAEGGCACGLVRYRLERAPLVVHCCHCAACQRETGSAFAVNALTEGVHLTRLPPAASVSPSEAPGNDTDDDAGLRSYAVPTPCGTGAVHQGCAACGVGLFGYHVGGGGPALVFVRAGTLDRGREVEPDVHVWTRSRVPFVEIRDGRPQYDGFYGDRREVLRPESLARLEALDGDPAAARLRVDAAVGK